ncbi:MAG TPA: DUF4230 domain-containing protein [Flavipsychrobacter sp.]|nr:DUF4230 domain-containing protein [Flavipsychrobacter sp.]
MEKTVLNNYSYVREIAELGTLEVNGISHMKRTNTAGDEGSWLGSLRKTLLEQTMNISVPYRAKYGVNMQDSSFRITRQDSLIIVQLPKPKLLSLELKLDAMAVNNKKGWLVSSDEELYINAQEKLYKEVRKQLEVDKNHLQQSQARVCSLLQSYFLSLGLKAQCRFEQEKCHLIQHKN